MPMGRVILRHSVLAELIRRSTIMKEAAPTRQLPDLYSMGACGKRYPTWLHMCCRADQRRVEMAILQPVSSSIAFVTAVTPVVTSITSGIFVLPLTSTVILEKNKLYYLAVYNQVSDSELGAVSTGLSAANDSPPINFRVQNIAGFTVGSSVSVSDISLQITPWLAAF